MSNVVQFPDMDLIEVQACEWIARLDRGSLTQQENEELKVWLAADPLHVDMLMEMARLLDQMTVLSDLKKLFPLQDVEAKSRGVRGVDIKWPKAASLGTQVLSHWRSAAVLSLTVMLLILANWNVSLFQFEQSISPNSFSTSVGEMKVVHLDDGSTVTLNTNSTFSMAFDNRQRVIELHQGEALFDVAHDKQRPFIVKANGSAIKAVGTAFNVEIGRENVEVTVTEGIVEIEPVLSKIPKPKIVAEASTTELAPKAILTRVGAGELAIIKMLETDVLPMARETIDDKLAWKQGELVFQGEPLKDVVAEVSRYTDHTFVIADNAIGDMRVGGRFKVGNIDNLLDILENGFNIGHTETESGLIFLSGREKSLP